MIIVDVPFSIYYNVECLYVSCRVKRTLITRSEKDRKLSKLDQNFLEMDNPNLSLVFENFEVDFWLKTSGFRAEDG